MSICKHWTLRRLQVINETLVTKWPGLLPSRPPTELTGDFVKRPGASPVARALHELAG